MELVRLVECKVLLVVEKILKVLDGECDVNSFEVELKKELDAVGCELLKEVLEALDRKFRESEDRKREWTIVRKNDRKEQLTTFGRLVYERTYYRHKESKEYAYLVDEKAGIKPHARVGLNLKAELTEASAGASYEGATVQVSRHNAELKVSKQTVATCVKEFKPQEVPVPQKKRQVRYLYVEADEDHLKVKGRRGAQARLIYIHEGIEEYPRRRLKNARYFTTVLRKPEEFWIEVCDYIEAHYELESIESIYLSGDGASWIQVGKEHIPGVIFILDKFHLAKYILRATAHVPELKMPIYQEIQKLNQQAVLDHLQGALKLAEKPQRQKRIQDTITYIKNNWDGIESSVNHPHVGCSAEGHVSHILSARLSSRPMAWSRKGAEKMAGLRAVKANGESIREHYLASQAPAPVIVELHQEIKEELRRLKEKRLQGRENLNNVPILNGGSNLTRRALKGLNDKMVV
jgi:hypothetical protein